MRPVEGKIRVGIAKTLKSIFIVLRSSFESTLNPVNKLKHSPISCVCVFCSLFVRFQLFTDSLYASVQIESNFAFENPLFRVAFIEKSNSLE